MENERSEFIKMHRCPDCGGTLVFRPEKGRLVCEYCDAEFDVPKDQVQTAPTTATPSAAGMLNQNPAMQNMAQQNVAPQAAQPAPQVAPQATQPVQDNPFQIGGFDFQQFYNSAQVETGENIPVYHCKNCGADVLAAGEAAALTCPYCASKIVLSDKLSGNVRPNGIIPFKIAQKDLKKHVDKFYKNKKLLPRNFFNKSHMEKVTGIYVPFWLFSGTVYGRCNYECTSVSTTTSGDYQYTTTKTYDVERDVNAGFAGIPIDASDKLNDKLADSVLPYNMSELVPYQSGYLSGFAADRFDVPGKSLQSRVESLMRTTTAGIAAKSLSSYNSTKLKSASLNATDIGVSYVLLPMYIFKIKYGKKKYEFAVNGQTGKVVGSLPTDKTTSRIYFLIRFGIVTAVIMLASIISYLMGGAF